MPRLATLCTLFLPITAFAQSETPRMAIVGLHEVTLDLATQETLVTDLAEAVDITGKADGLETGEIEAAIRGREEVIVESALLAGGRSSLTNGKNLINSAQPEDAVYALQEAVESLSIAVQSTNDTKELWEAWVYLGAAQLATGQAEGAEASFRAAAALNPDRDPNPAVFPPDVVGSFDSQRELLRKVPMRLSVKVDQDSTVFLDGREMGQAPVVLEGVLPGMHHVVAVGEGQRAYQLLRVEAAENGEGGDVDLTLGAPVLGNSAESALARSRQIGGLYRALGDNADDVDFVLLAGTNDGQLHMQLYAPATDAFSKPMSLPYADSPADEAVATVPLLMSLVTADGKLPSDSTNPLPSPLSLGANSYLSSILMDPREAPVITSSSPATLTKKSSPVVPIIVGVLAASAAGTGGYLLFGPGSTDPGNPYQGFVTVGPLGR